VSAEPGSSSPGPVGGRDLVRPCPSAAGSGLRDLDRDGLAEVGELRGERLDGAIPVGGHVQAADGPLVVDPDLERCDLARHVAVEDREGRGVAWGGRPQALVRVRITVCDAASFVNARSWSPPQCGVDGNAPPPADRSRARLPRRMARTGTSLELYALVSARGVVSTGARPRPVSADAPRSASSPPARIRVLAAW
jgi:hypothetical protein